MPSGLLRQPLLLTSGLSLRGAVSDGELLCGSRFLDLYGGQALTV